MVAEQLELEEEHQVPELDQDGHQSVVMGQEEYLLEDMDLALEPIQVAQRLLNMVLVGAEGLQDLVCRVR